jgi:TolA-binding protein
MKIVKYIILISFLILFGCGKESDKGYMDKAAEEMKDSSITDAVNSYETLIKEYPQSDLAPEALYKLALIYQNKMDKTLSEKECLQKSVEVYRNIYDKYPQNKNAAKALFMSGFILANELHNYDKATETYNLFLQKYPDNDLALSAKEELEHMGLSPEQILEKKKTTGI